MAEEISLLEISKYPTAPFVGFAVALFLVRTSCNFAIAFFFFLFAPLFFPPALCSPFHYEPNTVDPNEMEISLSGDFMGLVNTRLCFFFK